MSRTVYYISDGTGISAQTLGHSLMTQFEQVDFKSVTLPYIDSKDKAMAAITQINKSFNSDGAKPIVFSTIVKSEIRNIIAGSSAFVIDFFQTFIDSLEQELKVPSAHLVGLSHAVTDDERYNTRIEAINFSLMCDDGINPKNFSAADIVLLGISRTGKTPTCLYLALQFGIKAANYPLTPDDLNHPHLPSFLNDCRDKLFGLTINPERLHQIRSKRFPNSEYASKNQCDIEVKQAESYFKKEQIPYLNSTQLSIEELATHILADTGLTRRI